MYLGVHQFQRQSLILDFSNHVLIAEGYNALPVDWKLSVDCNECPSLAFEVFKCVVLLCLIKLDYKVLFCCADAVIHDYIVDDLALVVA
jgi:hypothetical protein